MASSETAAATAADYPDSYRDWSGLPEDLLLIAMAAMEVPELVRSGAVCRLWRSAFVAFRGLCLRSTRQSVPCLLYRRRSDAAVFLYSLSTHNNYHVSLSAEAASGVVGSAYGWLFTTDFAANPYLVNPLTGAQAALPPITTLERVMGRRLVFPVDGDNDRRRHRGVVVYDVEFEGPYGESVHPVTARRAREWMYRRVAMSTSPSAGADCVVLLMHMPYQELSFARPGDERWTSLSGILMFNACHFQDIVHNPVDGLFYLLGDGCKLRSLDLTGPSPTATNLVQSFLTPYFQLHGHQIVRYLVVTPCGDLLLVERLWRKRPMTPVGAKWLWQYRAMTTIAEEDILNYLTVIPEKEERIYDVSTMLMRISRLQYPQFVLQEKLPNGVGVDHALFLGHGGAAVCLTIEYYHPMIRGNCAYLTDDSHQTYSLPCEWLDNGIWDFGSSISSGRSLQKLSDAWRLHHPLANSPVPIWITPSLD